MIRSSRVYDGFTACVITGTTTVLDCDTVVPAGKYYRCYCNNS